MATTRKNATKKTAQRRATKKATTSRAARIQVVEDPPAKPARGKVKNAQAAEAKTRKTSALDAAAQVLAGSAEPLNAKELIEAMAARGLWTSPGGKTPHATLYSAILREINTKGAEARFVKTERGRFTAKA